MSIETIKAQELYNLMNQIQSTNANGSGFACLSDPNYLLLIDARSISDYEHYHIPTAIRPKVKKDDKYNTLSMILPFESLIECKENIIVYDGNSKSLEEDKDRPAVRVAMALSRAGAQVPIKVLYGGFQEFSANYPFYRSTDVFHTQRILDNFPTYPSEILPGSLFLGSTNQANDPSTRKSLKLDAFVSFTSSRSGNQLIRNDVIFEISDKSYSLQDLKLASEFIDKHRLVNERVIVSCSSGRSLAPHLIVYYLVEIGSSGQSVTKNDALQFVSKCRNDTYGKGPILKLF